MVEKILVDTNVWIYAAKNKVDVQQLLKKKFGIVGIYAPNVILKELEALNKNAEKGTDREAAKLALKLIKQKKIPQPKLAGTGDFAIINWAVENKGAVLTNDVELKIRLKALGVKVYYLRQKRLIKEW